MTRDIQGAARGFEGLGGIDGGDQTEVELELAQVEARVAVEEAGGKLLGIEVPGAGCRVLGEIVHRGEPVDVLRAPPHAS